MHKVLVPKHSGAHRVACLALYRALLQQCCSSSESISWLGETRSLVQRNFRKYKKLQSPSQTANALRAGYEALDLLSSSHSNPHNQHRITTLIARAKAQRDKYAEMQEKTRPVGLPSKPLTPKAARKEKSIRFQEETSRRHPNARSVLDRPQALGDHKRHIPVLVNARGLPFLRYKKPQPRNVSSVIRTKLGSRWNWIQRRDRLRVELLFAQDEEDWDRITENITETDTISSWSEPLEKAIVDVNARISNFDVRSRELAENMWKIVLAERALAEEEEATDRQPEQ